jgi:hypothetical protein
VGRLVTTGITFSLMTATLTTAFTTLAAQPSDAQMFGDLQLEQSAFMGFTI